MTATVTHPTAPAPQAVPEWLLAAIYRPLTPAELAEVDEAVEKIEARLALVCFGTRVMTGKTTWEKWAAGLPPQGRDEKRLYAEYDAVAAGVGEVPARDRCPYECDHSHPEPEGSQP